MKKKIRLSTMNAVGKLTAKKQNKVRKLNAGQLRESLKITLESICELPQDRFSEIIEFLMENKNV